MKTLNEIMVAINAHSERTGNSYYAVRGDDRNYNAGDKLEYSKDLTDDSETYGQELNGTSGTNIGYLYFDGEEEDIQSVKEAIDYNKKAYRYKNLYIITGMYSEYGTDENEILLSNAEIVCKIEL
jgi:hypothetical protein